MTNSQNNPGHHPDTDRLIRDLQQFGWCRIESVFSPQELAPIVQKIRFFTSKLELDPDNISLTDSGGSGAVAPRKLTEPFFRDPQFRRLAFDPRLLRYVESATGPRPDLVLDHVFMKPAKIGAEKPWHQDDYYFRIKPHGAGLSAWIALCDADTANGCLYYFSGSHARGLLEHDQIAGEPGSAHIIGNPDQFGRPVAVPARAGDVIFHHFHTVHGSGANLSNRDRPAYATHWTGNGVVASGPSWPRAYHLRDEYHDLLGRESLRNL